MVRESCRWWSCGFSGPIGKALFGRRRHRERPRFGGDMVGKGGTNRESRSKDGTCRVATAGRGIRTRYWPGGRIAKASGRGRSRRSGNASWTSLFGEICSRGQCEGCGALVHESRGSRECRGSAYPRNAVPEWVWRSEKSGNCGNVDREGRAK